MTRIRLLVSIGAIVAALAACASDDTASKKQTDALVPLMENLGDLEHPIKTDNPLAQKYFNQGLRLIFAFNHDEAIRAFRAAVRLDDNALMPWWGIAISLGPNYNVEAEKERSKAAYEALVEARKRTGGASPTELAYVEALWKRYTESPDADRKVLDQTYADAMRQLSATYPNDLDAAVLFAEAMMDLRPWGLWTHDGKPQEGTEEIVATLERVLAKAPNHPGANHFYIHAVEASTRPERGLDCALRLGGLMPGSGHLVHMPAHIYMRLGRYSDASDANKRAIEVDRAYIEKFKPEGIYPMMYYPHNIHFMWAALCIEGRSAEAIDAASDVVKMLPAEMVKQMPMLEAFMPTKLYCLALFHKWEDIFREPPPAEEFTFALGMWNYSQALARSATGQKHVARDHQKQLEEILAGTPEDKKAMRHSAAHLLRIASAELGATLDARDHNLDSATARLKEAIRLQDKLEYDEPPPWYVSERLTLGNLLLESNHPAEAEAVFREDLARIPENGWALYGLERGLMAQDRKADAAEVRQRFEKAWARADMKPF